MSLATLKAGMKAIITGIAGVDEITFQLQEMGFNPGCEVCVLSHSPFGGPVTVVVRGTTIALRRSEANCIQI